MAPSPGREMSSFRRVPATSHVPAQEDAWIERETFASSSNLKVQSLDKGHILF